MSSANHFERSRCGPSHGPRHTGTTHVAGAPASGCNDFTWERVKAGQCGTEGGTFSLTRDSAEEEYFLHHAADALHEAAALAKHAVAQGFVTPDLEVISIKYEQLRLVTDPHHYDGLLQPYDDSEYHPAEFETYEKTYEIDGKQRSKAFVVSPLTHHSFGDIRGRKRFEVLHPAARDLSFELLCKVDIEDGIDEDGELSVRTIDYACKLTIQKLPRAITYLSLKPMQYAVKVQYGELLNGTFLHWDEVYIERPGRFMLSNWIQPEGSQRAEHETHETPADNLKGKVENVNGQLCQYIKIGKDEYEPDPLLNFAVDEILAVYVPDNNMDDKTAVYEFAIHQMRDGTRHDDTILLKLGSIYNWGKLNADLQKQCYHYICISDKLTCIKRYLSALPRPPKTMTLTHFGRQSSGVFALGNCAFMRGEVVSHEEAGIKILQDTFNTGPNERLPVLRKNYPKMLIVPDPEVRFAFLDHLWNQLMPEQFLNNTMAAKASFALTVCHLHSSKFWSGSGSVQGVPAGWLLSHAPNTGKTESLRLNKGLLGLDHAGLFCGGTSSMPAVLGKLGQSADMSLQLDEMVTWINYKNKGDSQLCKDLAHTTYDQTVRGKLLTDASMGAREPLSSWIASSNVLCNENDMAFLQRVIVIQFKPLDASAVDVSKSSEVFQRWGAAKKVVSCLLPDLEDILLGGELDTQAISDCCNWIGIYVDEKYARAANIWGFLLYYLLNLTYLAAGTMRALNEVLEYISEQVFDHNKMTQKFVNPLQLFLIKCEECFSMDAYTTDPSQCVFWHNYRLDCAPTNANVMYPGQKFVALRVESCVKAIYKRLDIFMKASDINRSIKETDWVMRGRAYFWDVQKMWPPTKRQICEITQQEQVVPLEECELISASLKRCPCIFVLRAKYDNVVEEEPDDDVAPTSEHIKITSADPSVQPYNFKEEVTGGDWFGFRAVKDTALYEAGYMQERPAPQSPNSVLSAYGYDIKVYERPTAQRGLDFDECAGDSSPAPYDTGSIPGGPEKRARDEDLMDSDGEQSVRTHTHSPLAQLTPLMAPFAGVLGSLLRRRLPRR